MAEAMIDAKEEKFRKDNQWYSFTQAVYGALGWASFIGLLGTIASSAVTLAVGKAAAPEATKFALALFTETTPLLAIGGLMAFGIVCTYMSQREATMLKSIQDTHLAEANAKCVTQGQAVAMVQAPEHEQNCRADGKRWADVVAAKASTQAQLAV